MADTTNVLVTPSWWASVTHVRRFVYMGRAFAMARDALSPAGVAYSRDGLVLKFDGDVPSQADVDAYKASVDAILPAQADIPPGPSPAVRVR